MKTIKIIDLLNKIANGKEVPRKISYGGSTYLYNLLCNDYEDALSGDLLFEDRFDANKILNHEVKILDEEDEFEDITLFGKPALEELQTKDIKLRDLQSYMYLLAKDQNALIKNQKKIIERLNNEKKC